MSRKRTYGNGKINEAVKLELVASLGDSCGFCGEEDLTKSRRISFDHIEPFSEGGSDDINNLQILCRSCNAIKGNKPQHEFEQYMSKRDELPEMLSTLVALFPEIEDDIVAYGNTMPIERGYDFLKPLYDIVIINK